MRSEAIVYVLFQTILVHIPVTHSGTECLVPMTAQDYTIGQSGYFRYCRTDDVTMDRQTGGTINCGGGERLKLFNFRAFVPHRKTERRCTISKLRYKKKIDAGCLSQLQRDEIALPFISVLSGITVEQFKRSSSTQKIHMTASSADNNYIYKQIALDVGCETASIQRVDMCQTGSRAFSGIANASLFFSPRTFDHGTAQQSVDQYHHQQQHQQQQRTSGCYCYFKAVNSSKPIIARALDVRLHHTNQLLINSFQLSPRSVYWWQSGEMSGGLGSIELTGLSMDSLPDSVWFDVYGQNLNITCDTKPLEVEGLVTSPPQKFAKSSTEGLSIVYILIIVISVIVFVIIAISVAKFFQSRLSTASKSGAYSVDDHDASENFISSTYERGDDPPSPHDSVVVYSKDENKTAVYSRTQKTRRGGESDETSRLHRQSDSETDPYESGGDNSVLCGGSEQKFSHNAVVHDRPHTIPKTPLADDVENVYNHFPDHPHPDVVPTTATPTTNNSNNNIYDTTGTGVYSSLQQLHHPHPHLHHQLSTTENEYDMA